MCSKYYIIGICDLNYRKAFYGTTDFNEAITFLENSFSYFWSWIQNVKTGDVDILFYEVS